MVWDNKDLIAMGQNSKNPKLSVIVIFHDMVREAERTLFTLSAVYQNNVSQADYEVIAIDNGSTRALSEKGVQAMGANFKYHFFETTSPSPVAAINYGARTALGEYMALIVDGARMVTPGLVNETLRALRAFNDPLVCTLGWHLGPNVQNISMQQGYDQLAEDMLLKSIDWKNNGYRLFEISSQAQSSHVGLLGGMPDECSWLAIRRERFIELGGYDERFQSPGGGLVNHFFLNLALRKQTLQSIVLIGEGSFHQIHGGVATNVPVEHHPIQQFQAEYKSIIGLPYAALPPVNQPYYMGYVHPLATRFINKTVCGA